MDKASEDIKHELILLAGKVGPAALQPATVVEINADDTIVARLATGLEIDDVRLRSVVQSGNKVIMIPKVGSVVQIGRIENSEEYVVVAVEEITEIQWIIGGLKFVADQNGFLLEKGSENMRKLMIDFIDAILQERHNHTQGPTVSLTPDSVTRFNALKNRINNLFKNA
jgi:hypothetical protein